LLCSSADISKHPVSSVLRYAAVLTSVNIQSAAYFVMQ